jgi:hypothetical protein
MKAQSLPPVGTFIRVIRQPEGQHICTYTGLRGWVIRAAQNEDSCLVALVKSSFTRVKPGVTSTSVELGDFVVIKPTRQLQALAAEEFRKDAKNKQDPEFKAVLARTKAVMERHTNAIKERKSYAEGKTNPYLPKTAITRSSRFHYPTYADFEKDGHGGAKRRIAAKEKLTTEDCVHLAWCNEAEERCSFWSGDARVRALVQELDLDPYVGRFDTVLYRDEVTEFVTTRQLRVVVIRQLNRGRIILDIDGGKLDGYKEQVQLRERELPTHFFVTSARRRKLPAVPADAGAFLNRPGAPVGR